jgi:hypothetical protein
LANPSPFCIVAYYGFIRVEDSLEITWRRKMDSLKTILTGVSLAKLRGIVLETLEYHMQI